jgi:hypothetical protein
MTWFGSNTNFKPKNLELLEFKSRIWQSFPVGTWVLLVDIVQPQWIALLSFRSWRKLQPNFHLHKNWVWAVQLLLYSSDANWCLLSGLAKSYIFGKDSSIIIEFANLFHNEFLWTCKDPMSASIFQCIYDNILLRYTTLILKEMSLASTFGHEPP